MVEYAPYTLRSPGSLNAVSQRREFHGALIKVDEGIGCLHPWPEFGDAPIDRQLKLLRDGGTSSVIGRALAMAAVDGKARTLGVSLFAGLEIPPSHYSWDRNQASEPQARRVMDEGWRAIKTKGTRDIEPLLAWMSDRSADFSPQPGDPSRAAARGRSEPRAPSWRVDFNGCLDSAQFAALMRAMRPEVRERLDFIEDPFDYDPGAWSSAQREFGVRLACDKGLMRTEDPRSGECGYEVGVLKPGRREWRTMLPGIPRDARIVMTSAMDHAVGQSFAAYEAGLAWRELGSRMDLCGLCTEHLFEKDEFFERLRSHGGKLEVDRGGTGLGFDEALTRLAWKPL